MTIIEIWPPGVTDAGNDGVHGYGLGGAPWCVRRDHSADEGCEADVGGLSADGVEIVVGIRRGLPAIAISGDGMAALTRDEAARVGELIATVVRMLDLHRALNEPCRGCGTHRGQPHVPGCARSADRGNERGVDGGGRRPRLVAAAPGRSATRIVPKSLPGFDSVGRAVRPAGPTCGHCGGARDSETGELAHQPHCRVNHR